MGSCIKSLRAEPLEITEGGWGGGGVLRLKNFRCMKPTCLQDFFFSGTSFAWIFFPHISSFVTNLRFT